MDATGRARITDFGLAMVTQDLDSIRNASGEHENSGRWIAPEILDGRGTYSKEADVFSFAMVTIEVRCGCPTRVGVWLIFIHFNEGFHWRHPVQEQTTSHGYVGDHRR